MLFKKNGLYFQISAGAITGKETASGLTVIKKCSGLLHPRTLMGDFVSIETGFREIVNELSSGRLLAVSPSIVVHLPPGVEGGYTNVEIRAFKEAAFGAGGREVFVTDNAAPLTDEQIKNRQFSELDG